MRGRIKIIWLTSTRWITEGEKERRRTEGGKEEKNTTNLCQFRPDEIEAVVSQMVKEKKNRPSYYLF